MIDTETFRSRIGRFCHVTRCKRSSIINRLDRNFQPTSKYQSYKILQVFIRLAFIAVVIANAESIPETPNQTINAGSIAGLPPIHVQADLHERDAGLLLVQADGNDGGQGKLRRRKLKVNFLARYTYGNKQNPKGMKNFHINIRSLANKVSEVKNIVKEHQPHILGISECELNKSSNKSWSGVCQSCDLCQENSQV